MHLEEFDNKADRDARYATLKDEHRSDLTKFFNGNKWCIVYN